MTDKEKLNYVLKELKRAHAESQDMWQKRDEPDGKPLSYIIGSLQGTLSGLIQVIDDKK